MIRSMADGQPRRDFARNQRGQSYRSAPGFRLGAEPRPGQDPTDPLAIDEASIERLREQARCACGLEHFLTGGAYDAFTDTFEDLHGLPQLPGLAAQDLMAKGYGFGAEGDWKTSARLHVCKQMAAGRAGGTSFMEDYTYHLEAGQELVLGAHMLEVCPSIAADTPHLEIHPLGIGGKQAPARLVFDAAPGPALNISLIDLGNRFRLMVNLVDTVVAPAGLPHLPVVRACWQPRPDFRTSAAAWIHAGAAHHSVYTSALQLTHLQDFAEMAGIECLVIDGHSREHSLCQELRWNDIAYGLAVSHG